MAARAARARSRSASSASTSPLPAGAHGHLGHRALVGDAGGDHGAGLQGGERERVGAEGREEVRVHLHRVDERRVAGRRAARAGDDGDLDVALLQPQPRLVERPGPVHLDVGVALGWPGADGVEVRRRTRRPGR